jgi:hypothetical protein
MDAKRGSTWIRVLRAILVLAVGASTATARPNAPDEIYRSTELDGHRGMTVAILPAVAVAADAKVEGLVERSWYTLYRGAETRWMPVEDVRARLAEAVGDPTALIAEVRSQIWHDGTVRPLTARVLAGLLGVDAVLSVRVDRLEIADGGRGVAGMTATILDADGVRLWSISGTQSHGANPSSRTRNFDTEIAWVLDPRMEPDASAHDMGSALLGLFGRWAWQLPTPLYGEGAEPPQYAENRR